MYVDRDRDRDLDRDLGRDRGWIGCGWARDLDVDENQDG